MWAGVTNGFALIKLSGSPKRYGFSRDRVNRRVNMTINPTMSLKVKYGWKGTLSSCLETPRGLFAPDW